MRYVSPNMIDSAFNCPHCHVFCLQEWYHLSKVSTGPEKDPYYLGKKTNPPLKRPPNTPIDQWIPFKVPIQGIRISRCTNPDCQKEAVWVGRKMVHPSVSTTPLAHEDMPEDVKEVYDKARAVFPFSHEASSAMLRSALEQLLNHLDPSSNNLSKKLDRLIQKGTLPEPVIQAMDSIRLIGNDAIHPGKIQWDEPQEIALLLFELMNMIVEETITKPNKVRHLYSLLPESRKKIKSEQTE